MATHTPGPWKLYQGSDDGFWIGLESKLPIAGPVYGPVNDREANARLIAAAPDLLAALNNLLNHCDIAPEGETIFERHVQAGRAAIARAEGR